MTETRTVRHHEAGPGRPACLAAEMGVSHVGMEATGIYWHPVHAVLENAFTIIVGNASHMRNVPLRPLCGRLLRSRIAGGDDARRTKDAEWIADLVRHGLVRASFVPAPEVRVLRELICHRKAVVGNQASERNRTLQLLESANLKLASVMSDVFGASGMLMLQALADGRAAPVEMADLASAASGARSISAPGTAPPSLPPADRFAMALDGRLAGHQRLLLGLHIRRLAEIDRDLAEIEAAIGAPCARSRRSRLVSRRSPAWMS